MRIVIGVICSGPKDNNTVERPRWWPEMLTGPGWWTKRDEVLLGRQGLS